MGETRKLGKKALLDLVCRLLALNFSTFLSAYPQIPNIDSGCCANQPLAKDFSGVYIGAWRLFNDPGLQPYKREGMGLHDHSRSYRPASARSSPGLGILNRLFLAVERRPIKSVRDSSVVPIILPWQDGKGFMVRAGSRTCFLRSETCGRRPPTISNLQ